MDLSLKIIEGDDDLHNLLTRAKSYEKCDEEYNETSSTIQMPKPQGSRSYSLGRFVHFFKCQEHCNSGKKQ